MCKISSPLLCFFFQGSQERCRLALANGYDVFGMEEKTQQWKAFTVQKMCKTIVQLWVKVVGDYPLRAASWGEVRLHIRQLLVFPDLLAIHTQACAQFLPNFRAAFTSVLIPLYAVSTVPIMIIITLYKRRICI